MLFRVPAVVAVLSLAVLLPGCSKEEESTSDSEYGLPPLVNVSQIVITHIGVRDRPAGVKRTYADAVTLANDLHKRILDGEDFAALATEYSEDEATRARGGVLGNSSPAALPPEIVPFLIDMKTGDVREPTPMQHGIVILRREPLDRPIAAKHILIAYKGASRAESNITRSKEEAKTRAEECLKRLADGEKFSELVREYSDGPTRTRGGDLGEFSRGSMVQAFEEAAFACEVGKTTGIVETTFGFHIILRYQ